MAVPDGSGGAGRHPGNSPEWGRGRRRKQSRGSETEKVGDGAAAVDGAGIHQALQGSRGQHLLSGYLMNLVKDTENYCCICSTNYQSTQHTFLTILRVCKWQQLRQSAVIILPCECLNFVN